jgi:hypothetical protein
MPNIVFYIEIDYLSIDESKLLNSNEDKAKTQGLCSHRNKHSLYAGSFYRRLVIDEHLLSGRRIENTG